MKSRQTKLVIIDGCGDELLDVVLATVNYELSGDGAVLVHTEDLNQSNDTNSRVEALADVLNGYEGLVLLRR